jgi:F-type H+-transporting ATPase subunit epsilon
MFTLTLVTPEKKLVTGQEIEEIFVPAAHGELNILPGHAPLMTTLSTGVLRYRLKGESAAQRVAISWGYCQVNPHGVNVLAETAERPEEIDVERVQRAEKAAEQKLASGELEFEQIEKYHRKLSRAANRRAVARGDGGAV